MIGLFFSGFSAATFLACSLFFVKFWLASRDRFFLIFAGAFGLLALERGVGLFLWAISNYDRAYADCMRTWLYLIRLSAFGLIVISFVQKNRRPSAP